MTDKDRIEAIKAFLKEAFVIDGEITYITQPKTFSTYFCCTDSKRNVFYIGLEPADKK